MIAQNQVTIIIPHLGKTEVQRNALKECLRSLLATVKCKIIVAYNAVEGGEFIESLKHEQVKIMILEEQGQCKAVNAAIATTNTPYILVTNDDMIYSLNWFQNLTSNIVIDGHLCVSPKLVEPQNGAPTFETFFAGGAGGDFDLEKWINFSHDYFLRSDEEKKIRTGFNLPFLIDRELWNIVGGYDINYDPWGSNSDSDLEYSIKLAGIQPIQNQQAIVYHYSQTSGTFEPRNRSYWEDNWQYFITKWGFPRTDTGIWQASFIIPTQEEGRIFAPWWEDLYKDQIPMVQSEYENA